MGRPNKPREMNAASAVASNVRGYRESYGWSSEALAERLTRVGCPIHRSAIYKIEQGARKVDPDELVALSAVFSVSVDVLVSGREWDKVPSSVREALDQSRQAAWQLEEAQEQLQRAQEEVSTAEIVLELALLQLDRLPIATRIRLRNFGHLPTAVHARLEAALAER